MNSLALDPITMALHELRSPLGLMANAARAAAEECDDDAVRARCELLLRTAENLLVTTQHVLELAGRDESTGKCLFDPVHVAVSAVRDMGELGLPIRVAAPTFPAAQRFFGAKGQLVALLTSLISNSATHGAPGATIDVEVRVVAGAVEVEIANAVSGISARRGLGLGTYICERIAQSLPAEFSFARTPGHFTTLVRLQTCSPTPIDAGRPLATLAP